MNDNRDVGRCIDCSAPGVSAPATAPDFPLARCTACNLTYAVHWPVTLKDGATFHDGNVAFYERMAKQPGWTGFVDLNLQRTAKVLNRLAERVPSRTLLDVGCGKGGLVAVASRNGWTALGIDLAPGAVEIAKAQGLDCRVLDFFSPQLDQARYGLISMSEFIEHVPEPSRFLRRAHELLEPGGLLYLTTPNFNSLGRRGLGQGWGALFEGHVTFFTRKTLRLMAERSQFVVISLETGGLSVAAARSLVRRSPTPTRSEQYASTQALRNSLHVSRTGRLAKRLVDPLVSVSGLGETLRVILRRA